MNKIIRHRNIIFGLGKSGMSCARYFDRVGTHYTIIDTRSAPPNQMEIKNLEYCDEAFFGRWDKNVLDTCERIIVSPGIALSHQLIIDAQLKNIPVCGDIDIFVENCDSKIIAITGSNGKSTVTELTEELIKAAGFKAQKAGNIGLPVLDYLATDRDENAVDYFVLELSSFQLDITTKLAADVAVLLNISEDHMDRYENYSDYIKSKQRIFRNAKHKVFNLDDKNSIPEEFSLDDFSFSTRDLKESKNDSFANKRTNNHSGLKAISSDKAMRYQLMVNEHLQVSSSQLSLAGKHNYANVLASFSVMKLLGIDISQRVIERLCHYQGMPHRFQLVNQSNQCEWINDSKATNVGATIAALDNFDANDDRQLILIAGGDSKQSDLSPLKIALEKKVDSLVLLGQDAKLIANLTSKIKAYFVSNMHQAVEKSKSLIEQSRLNQTLDSACSMNKQAVVLLSPACSSLDMYRNFEERGTSFSDAVNSLVWESK